MRVGEAVMSRRLRVPVLEPDGHGGARIRTERKPGGPRIHRPDEDAKRRPLEPWRRGGYGSEYRAERQECIDRAHGRCECCGRQVARRNRDGSWTVTGGQTHHERPLRDGGGEGRPRLRLLCTSCHARADALLRAKERGMGAGN